MSEVFVHEKAICESKNVGRGTRIWPFAHVLPGARLGSDCNVCECVFIENDVQIGNRVTIKTGVQLWDGTTVEDDVFIGPNATFANDLYPRSKVYPENFLRTIVKKGASIGANATILPGIEIGAGAMVGAGAVVTRSVPPNATVVGNPARIVGYVDADKSGHSHVTTREVEPNAPKENDTEVKGVRIFRMPRFTDIRGELSVGEFTKDLPFQPARYFVVYNVPSRETRGEHAHRANHQFMICIAGSCTILVDDGISRREFIFDSPVVGMHVPPMIWGTQYNYSSNAVLLVFASLPYDANDYIRDYSEFKMLVQR